MHIKSAEYIISSPDYKQCPKADKPEYAFIGRSNVGKSSLINMLCNNSKLAKTSSAPGKTQLINHFVVESVPGLLKEGQKPRKEDIEQWYLVDLPGYGYAKVSASARRRWEQMIEGYLRHRPNLTNVFVLIDSRHEPQKIDLAFLDQLGKWQVPFCIVFTKADKETQKVVSQHVKDFLNAMRKTWQFLPQHFVTSAVKNLGRDKILGLLEEMNKEYLSQNEK